MTRGTLLRFGKLTQKCGKQCWKANGGRYIFVARSLIWFNCKYFVYVVVLGPTLGPGSQHTPPCHISQISRFNNPQSVEFLRNPGIGKYDVLTTITPYRYFIIGRWIFETEELITNKNCNINLDMKWNAEDYLNRSPCKQRLEAKNTLNAKCNSYSETCKNM